MPEYAQCETAAFESEPVKPFRRVRRYRYEMMGIVDPKYDEENSLITYGRIGEDPLLERTINTVHDGNLPFDEQEMIA